MANNEPNKPEDVIITPSQEAPVEEKAAPATPLEAGGDTPAPEMSAEQAADLEHEGKSALHEIGDDGLEPPTPTDIPAPGDVVVSFEKINEIVSGKQAAAKEAEQTILEKSGPTDKKAEPEKPGPDKGKENEPKTADSKPKPRQPKATEKADKKPSRPAKQEKQAKAAQVNKPDKQKQAASIGGDGDSVSTKSTEQAQQKTPPPELPPEPRQAPRPGEKEQIVYLLSQ